MLSSTERLKLKLFVWDESIKIGNSSGHGHGNNDEVISLKYKRKKNFVTSFEYTRSSKMDAM